MRSRRWSRAARRPYQVAATRTHLTGTASDDCAARLHLDCTTAAVWRFSRHSGSHRSEDNPRRPNLRPQVAGALAGARAGCSWCRIMHTRPASALPSARRLVRHRARVSTPARGAGLLRWVPRLTHERWRGPHVTAGTSGQEPWVSRRVVLSRALARRHCSVDGAGRVRELARRKTAALLALARFRTLFSTQK